MPRRGALAATLPARGMDGEPPQPDAVRLDTHQAALREVVATRSQHTPYHVGRGDCTKPFHADADYRRTARPGKGQDSVEVGIQRHDDTILLTRDLKDSRVCRASQSALACVNGIDACTSEQLGR